MKFTQKLNTYFSTKIDPEIVIEFLDTNIFLLIDEIPFIPSELGRNLKLNYNSYYQQVIEK